MQRYSKKREAILRCLQSTDMHPTADWIHRQLLPEFPDLSLATVYRNLTQMKSAGQIRSLGVIRGQERFDGVLRPHSHCICVRCGAVRDLEGMLLPESLRREAEARSGWQITGSTLRLSGLCPACRQINL